LTTESTGLPFECCIQHRERNVTILTFSFSTRKIFISVTRCSEELVGTRNAFRTVHAVFVRWVVLELIPTPLTLSALFRSLPVAVLRSTLRVTLVTIRPACLRVVELRTTSLAGPIGQRVAVDLRVVLSHPLFGVERRPAGRTVHPVGVGSPSDVKSSGLSRSKSGPRRPAGHRRRPRRGNSPDTAVRGR